MPRRARHGDIGAHLVAARAQGVAWKHLMAHYGLSRTRLHQLHAAEILRLDVHEHRGAGPEAWPAVMLGAAATRITTGEPDMPPKVSKPAPIQAPPTQNDAAIEEARRREIVAAQRARGRAATILTSGQGDTQDAPTARRMLMGG